jgi:hypothetical protein
VLAGIRAHYGPERVEPLLEEHEAHVPVLRSTAEALVPLFQPTAAEQKLLRAIDGAQSMGELRRAGILDPLHAGQLFAALHLGCVLAFHVGPVAKRQEPARKAPERPAARPAPPPPPPKLAAAVLGAIPLVSAPQPQQAPAHDTFDPLVQLRRKTGGAARGASDPKQARLEAENTFNQGLRLLRESLLPGALREFQRAVERWPEEPEYRLLEAWLEYRTVRDADARGLAAAKVRACGQRMLQASRTSARPHSILGQLALQEGDLAGADQHLRLALRYDPSDLEAQRGIRLLEKRKR